MNTILTYLISGIHEIVATLRMLQIPFYWPGGLAGLPLAVVAGFFGATFFILARLNTRLVNAKLDDIEAFYDWKSLIVRCLFGAGGATILYFFFETGLLKGTIWPDLTEIGFAKCCGDSGLVPNKDLSLLLIWSVLAGYSETFVPSLLARTEAGANSQNS